MHGAGIMQGAAEGGFYINKSFSFICIIDKVTKRILCIQLNVWENRTVRVCALEKGIFALAVYVHSIVQYVVVQ